MKQHDRIPSHFRPNEASKMLLIAHRATLQALGTLSENEQQSLLIHAQMLDYNVPGGKLNRGMAVADVLTAVKEGQVRHSQSVLCIAVYNMFALFF